MRIITAEDIESRELTPQEKGWLRQRDRHAEVERNEELFEVSPGRDADNETDGDNYEQWKVRELQEEGENRTPPVDFTGCSKKADYVLALRAWDMEHAEE